MLIRISLIVAIVAGLAVGALNFIKVKEIITTTRAERDDWHQKWDKTDADLRKTSKELEVTKTERDTATNALVTATGERDRAINAAAVASKKAAQLTEDLDNTRKTLADAQAEVAAYRATGFNPEQVLVLGKRLKTTQDDLGGAQDENKVLTKKMNKLAYELEKYKGLEPPIVYLPESVKGQVVVSDPKWDFVVINVGEDQGILQDGELLVNRNGRLVAKVKVTSVQKNRSIANVMPGWKLGELMEGDLVIPAHPAS